MHDFEKKLRRKKAVYALLILLTVGLALYVSRGKKEQQPQMEFPKAGFFSEIIGVVQGDPHAAENDNPPDTMNQLKKPVILQVRRENGRLVLLQEAAVGGYKLRDGYFPFVESGDFLRSDRFISGKSELPCSAVMQKNSTVLLVYQCGKGADAERKR